MTTPDEHPSLGADLRAAREAAGMSVEQVSERTRIRATLIRDLEADRFDSSGAPVYARGHLRSIAGAVGTDPAPLLARFDREVGIEQSPVVEAVVAAPQRATTSGFALPVAQAPERRGPNWAVAGVAAVGLLTAVIAIGTVVDSEPREPTALGTVPSATPAPVSTPTSLPSEATAQAPRFEGADLRIRTIGGASWVRVKNSARKTLFEGVLADGQSKDFRDATSLNIVVGNAGAVSMVCSGKDLPRAGGKGKIARFSCSDTGLVPA